MNGYSLIQDIDDDAVQLLVEEQSVVPHRSANLAPAERAVQSPCVVETRKSPANNPTPCSTNNAVTWTAIQSFDDAPPTIPLEILRATPPAAADNPSIVVREQPNGRIRRSSSRVAVAPSLPQGETGGYDLEYELGGSFHRTASSSSSSSSSIDYSSHEGAEDPQRKCLASSSFYIFSDSNMFRIAVFNLVHNKIFESFVLLVILLNCVLLALDDPTSDVVPTWNANTNFFILAVFTLEMVLKFIAHGAALHDGAYFRSSWNWLDFVIVCLGYLTFVPGVGNFTAITVLRVLRPLRSLNAVPQLKAIVKCLLHSVKGLVNVFVLAIFIYFVFAILAVQLWMGNFQYRCFYEADLPDPDIYCTVSNGGSLVGVDCPTNMFCAPFGNPNFGISSFDNVASAMLIVFQSITLEGWSVLMFIAMDTCGWPAAIFFLAVILFGSYFVLNLALAVISGQFVDIKDSMAVELKAAVEQDFRAKHEKRMSTISLGHSVRVNADAVSPTPRSPRMHLLEYSANKSCSTAALSDGTATIQVYNNHNDGLVDQHTGCVDDINAPIDILAPLAALELRDDATLLMLRHQLLETTPGRLLFFYHRKRLFPEFIQSTETKSDGIVDEFTYPHYGAFDKAVEVVQTIRKHLFTFTEGAIEEHHMAQIRDQEVARLTLLEMAHAADNVKNSIADGRTAHFTVFVYFCIAANTIVLAAERFDEDDTQSRAATVLNILFTCVFATEMGMRNISLGPIAYWSNAVNAFDGIVTTISVIEIAVLSGSSGASVLRAFRILRIIQTIPALRAIVDTFSKAIRETGYLIIIFLLYFFVASLIGMQVFNSALDNSDVTSRFSSFLLSFFTVVQVLTFDSWPDNMYVVMNNTNYFACVFFICCVLLGNFVILNLLLAILINSFEEASEAEPEKKLFYGPQSPTTAEPPAISANHNELSISERNAWQSPELTLACDLCGQEPLTGVFGAVPAADLAKLLPVSCHTPAACLAAVNRKRKEQRLMTLIRRASNFDGTDGELHGVLVRPFDDYKLIQPSLHKLPAVAPHVASPMDKYRGATASQRDFDEAPFERVFPAAAQHFSDPDDSFENAIDGIVAEADFLSIGAEGSKLISWQHLRECLRINYTILQMRAGEEQVGGTVVAQKGINIPQMLITNGGDSLFLFGPRNPIREELALLIEQRYFEGFIMVVVLASSICLAIDNPRGGVAISNVLDNINNVFTVIFCVEAAMKIIALNFVFHKKAYLRDPRNILDFIVVIVSVVSWILQSIIGASSLNSLKILRSLRVLRPLLFINKYRGLRMVVLTIIHSIKGIASMALLAFLIFLIFAILSTQLFGGRLYSCNDKDTFSRVNCTGNYSDPRSDFIQNVVNVSVNITVNGTTVSKMISKTVTVYSEIENIVPRVWMNRGFNYDNTLSSLIALLHMATLDNWGAEMYWAIGATDHDHGNIPYNKPWVGLYFVVFVMVGSIFILNMFVGVVTSNYQATKDKMDGLSLLTDDQRLWVETQRMMLNFRPQRLRLAGEGVIQQVLGRVAMDPRFDVLSGIVVLLNVLVISMDHYNQTSGWDQAQDALNILFTILFAMEALMKIIAFEGRFFYDSWNQFDLFIVLIGIVDLTITGVIPFNVGLLRVLRVFRIMRILALVRKAKDVRILLETLWYSIPSLANIGAFMFLILFVFSVLGVQLFALIPQDGVGLTPHMNFENFGTAFLFLIQVTTLDNWGATMTSLSDTDLCGISPQGDKVCGTPFAPLFFYPFIFISGYVMVNLFVAIILDNFETTMELDKSNLKMNDLKKFADAWALFDPDATMLIQTKRFPQLLAALKPPLGIARAKDRLALLRLTREHVIPEHGGVIHFVETLIPLARQVMKVKFEDNEIREHEDHWKTHFPDLHSLPISYFNKCRVTVDHYFAATYIAAAHRRKMAKDLADELRRERRRELHDWYDKHKVMRQGRESIHRMDDFDETRRQNFIDRRQRVAKVTSILTGQEMSIMRSVSSFKSMEIQKRNSVAFALDRKASLGNVPSGVFERKK